MFGLGRKSQMPAAGAALPGRATAIPTAETHFVSGRPLKGPWPEGLAVAVSLLGEGYPRVRAWGIAALTGLVEPIGGLLGAGIITLSQPLLPWGLAFAAGAMLYVISHEIIPETHRSGHQNRATLGLAIGLVLMLFLDVWLG